MGGGCLAVVSALACMGVQLMGQSHIALGEGEAELPLAPVFLTISPLHPSEGAPGS